MKLEVGKVGITNGGARVLIDERGLEDCYSGKIDGKRWRWNEDGTLCNIGPWHEHTIIAIAPAEPEGPTDSEILDWLNENASDMIQNKGRAGGWRHALSKTRYPTLRAAAAAAMGGK